MSTENDNWRGSATVTSAPARHVPKTTGGGPGQLAGRALGRWLGHREQPSGLSSGVSLLVTWLGAATLDRAAPWFVTSHFRFAMSSDVIVSKLHSHATLAFGVIKIQVG